MTLTEIPTNELGRMMRERVTCVLRMEAVQLNLDFAPMKLDDGNRAQTIKNLSACDTVPAVLDDSRRELLAEPFVGTRYLFASADFEDVWALL